MVYAGRMGDGQAARAAPRDVDAVVSSGEAGDQRQVRQALDQILVELELAGDDQGANVAGGLDRRAFPEAIDIVGAFQEGAQRGQMPLHDQDGGTLGHGRRLSRFRRSASLLIHRSSRRTPGSSVLATGATFDPLVLGSYWIPASAGMSGRGGIEKRPPDCSEGRVSVCPLDQRPNFWCWTRLGMMLSAPRRRILSCS